MALVKVENLEKAYGGRKVVNGLNFEVNSGEIVGLLGPNGAGKTTAFYMTVGLIRPDKGQVHFLDQDVTNLPMHRRAQMGMGYLAQEPSVFRNLSVEDNILSILENHEPVSAVRKERLESLLDELHLKSLRTKKAAHLSGGERRRLEITRALVTNPKFLLLDEPFANIDPISIHEVKHLIKLLAKKNIGILITDHNAREIFSVVDTSYIVCEGRVIKSGKPDFLINDSDAKKYYLGENFAY
jgi:lipopolysaccharide export system ATP-binding protein